MNREQRRKFNKQNKTNFTKQEFDTMELYERVKAGNLNYKDLDLPDNFIHVDNEELVPNGTAVKLYYEGISTRPQKDLTQEFINWIEENKDNIFHVTREKAQNSLVCLEEDKPSDIHAPWLFDIYSDLLYFNETLNKWVILADLELGKSKN